MTARKRLMAASLGLAGVILPLAAAGSAQADETATEGYPSTQNPLQALSAVEAIGAQSLLDYQDALNGDNRPDGANGNESEFPQPDPRFVEGPLSGFLTNGPLE